MGYPTGIEFTDATWNPVGGCTIASVGCINCYAPQLAGTQMASHRVTLYRGTTTWRKGRPTFNGKLTVLPDGHPLWKWPERWPGAPHPIMGDGKPSLVFVADMSDLFHEQRPTEVIDKVVETIVASRHIGQLLTRRANVMAAYLRAQSPSTRERWRKKLWLGISCERQREFDLRWPYLRPLADDGWTVFVALAPMLAPVKLPKDLLDFGNRLQVICSGEQCPGDRPMDPAWPRAVRDQCAEEGVPFFMKQMAGAKRGAKRIPLPDLFIRQFPALSGRNATLRISK
jgi:protein gp37